MENKIKVGDVVIVSRKVRDSLPSHKVWYLQWFDSFKLEEAVAKVKSVANNMKFNASLLNYSDIDWDATGLDENVRKPATQYCSVDWVVKVIG